MKKLESRQLLNLLRSVRPKKPSAPTPPSFILKPYRATRIISRPLKFGLIVTLVIFSFVYGAAFALLVPYAMAPIIVPLLFLGVVAVWALPDVTRGPEILIPVVYILFYLSLLLWPNYLALVLPGLPWITVLRLTAFPLAALMLVSASVSPSFRTTIKKTLQPYPIFWKLLVVYVAFQVLSIPLSDNKSASANFFLSALTNWISIFLCTVYVCRSKVAPKTVTTLLSVEAFVLAALSFWEHHLGHVPWLGHIPTFLQVNDPNVIRFLAGTTRAGTGYRSQATFTTSLAFSEYLALTMPFILHFIFKSKGIVTRCFWVLAAASIVLAAVFAQARTGMIGIALSILAYPSILVLDYWNRNKGNITANVIVGLSPLFLIVGGAIAYLVPAFHHRIFGGGTVASSNEARLDQLKMGIPMVLQRPWGHGIGQGAETLGYSGPGGDLLSIDVYPLRVALELGVGGLIVYYGMMITGIWIAARTFVTIKGSSKERDLLIPVLIALVSFIFMQFVCALEDNEPTVYTLLGILVSLCYTVEARGGNSSAPLSGAHSQAGSPAAFRL